MKVEVNESKKEKELKFPCLMISENGTIILAAKITDDGIEGTVLKDVYPIKREAGYHLKTYNPDCFKPFNGSITLSND